MMQLHPCDHVTAYLIVAIIKPQAILHTVRWLQVMSGLTGAETVQEALCSLCFLLWVLL